MRIYRMRLGTVLGPKEQNKRKAVGENQCRSRRRVPGLRRRVLSGTFIQFTLIQHLHVSGTRS